MDSSQDGGTGRYTLLPRTTKKRTTTNLKTKNNQNCQKIELDGNPTTKELKRKHSFMLVGGKEMGSGSREDGKQGSSWRLGSHIHVKINWEEQLRSETDHATQGPSMWKKSLKTSSCKNLWVLWWVALPAS